MVSLHNALAILSLAATVLSQGTGSIIPADEPQCANQCPIFVQALQACQPDQGNQAQYASCFCQSAYLVQLKSSSTNLCPAQCSDSDFGKLTVWYNGFCANGGTPPATTAPPAGTTMVTVTNTPPAAAPTTSSATNGGATALNQGDGANDFDPNAWTDASGWFHTHWKWVLMIIILAIAFTAIGVGGAIWHRRYKNRREYGDSTAPRSGQASHPEMSQWAPGQHSVHDFGTGSAPNVRYNTTDSGSPVSREGNIRDIGPAEGNAEGKGKGKEVVGVDRVQSPGPSTRPARAPSRRLTKTPVGGR